MLWYYIQKEVCACMCNVPLLCTLNCVSCNSNRLPFICSTYYSDCISLQEIERSPTPYTQLTLDHFVRDDIKLKVRRALSKVIPMKPHVVDPPSFSPTIHSSLPQLHPYFPPSLVLSLLLTQPVQGPGPKASPDCLHAVQQAKGTKS